MRHFWLLWVAAAGCTSAQEWPRWRGPEGNGVSAETALPVRWSATENVAWKAAVPGEGSSSPVVWGDSVFLTSALDGGTRRVLHCLDRRTGRARWLAEVRDPNPERTSALAGHAAPTPATDGRHVVALFGTAGVACYDFEGGLLWRQDLGEFESELGLATSPVLHGGRVYLVCDHDGDRFTSFDSFMLALDVRTGATVWRKPRPGLGRSWSTPILAPELVVNAQDELRGFDPETGELLWRVPGMTGWVAPSPVSAEGLIVAASGKDGPVVAVAPGGRLLWQVPRAGPYVSSPLLYGGLVYLADEQARLTCLDASDGAILYRTRLRGKFTASPVGGDGKVYVTNEEGTTFVVKAGRDFALLAENALGEECLASPAVSRRALFLRTRGRLYCIRDLGIK